MGRLTPVAVASPTERPKSVHNRCEIEVLVAFLCCHFAFFICSVGIRTFVGRLSQIASFSSFVSIWTIMYYYPMLITTNLFVFWTVSHLFCFFLTAGK